ncbi:MAG: tyrosine-type recombinase/integrase, partial [Methylomonas sp.]
MAEKLNNDVVYRTAKPKEKDYSINDGGGLALHVNAKGSKLWRFVYTFEGKRYKIAFGNYPATSLESARQQAAIAREDINGGINPPDKRKSIKQVIQQDQQNTDRIKAGLPVIGSFGDVAHQWLKSLEHLTKPQTHIKKTSRIERLAFPLLGDKPIGDIKAADI